MNTITRTILCALALAAVVATASAANLVQNPSFEDNQGSFTVFPGYISGNTAIDDWTTAQTSNVGINGNAGSGNPFADNGVKPDGVAVGFVQSTGAASTLSQTIGGLSIGTLYQVTARINARTGGTPNFQISMGGTPLLTNQVLNPVGGGNPYRYVTLYRQAAANNETLEFQNLTGGDTTLVVDAVSADPVFTTGWSATPWSNDATSGIDAANPTQYSHAYNLGSATSPIINGVTFQGIAGGNPAVPGKFTVTGMNDSTGAATNVTDPGSNTLSNTFIYGGNPGAITINGLKPGLQYLATFYGVSFGGGNGRAADFSVNGDRITVDENALPGGDGVKLQYSYIADNSGSMTFNVQPYNSNNTIHFHGFANEDNSITGLFNTGTDASRVSLADDAIDSHWTILSGPISGNAIVATSAGGFPIDGNWIGDNSTSAWITPSNDTVGPPGDYTYRTTFNLAGTQNLQVLLQGLIATDNDLVSILLNGTPVTIPAPVSFNAFVPFSFTGLAIPGVNTLDFVVNNGSPTGPTGLRVQFNQAIAVPEPCSLALLTIGLIGLVRVRRPAIGR